MSGRHEESGVEEKRMHLHKEYLLDRSFMFASFQRSDFPSYSFIRREENPHLTVKKGSRKRK